MTKYLLDTDIVSYLADSKSQFHDPVFRKLYSLSNKDKVFIHILTLYELEYGISCGVPGLEAMLSETERTFLNRLPVISLSREAAKIFGRIKYTFRKKIEMNFKNKNELEKNLQQKNVDFIIASSAIETGSVLVSNDAVFLQIKEIEMGFRVENWTK